MSKQKQYRQINELAGKTPKYRKVHFTFFHACTYTDAQAKIIADTTKQQECSVSEAVRYIVDNHAPTP